MSVPDRSLIYAIGVALLVHAVLFVGVRWAPVPAPVAGASGMRLALAPSASVAPSSENLNVETSEQEPVPDEVLPEPVREPVVEREPVPIPEPEQPARRTAEPAPAPQPVAQTQTTRSPPSAGTAGTSGTVSAAGESGVGDADAQADYIAQVASWLARHKRYPRQAERRRQEGVVHLAFTVTRDGHVTQAHIVEGSGFALLDREVEAMIERAQPLPSFPPSLKQSQMNIVVPVRFALNQR